VTKLALNHHAEARGHDLVVDGLSARTAHAISPLSWSPVSSMLLRVDCGFSFVGQSNSECASYEERPFASSVCRSPQPNMNCHCPTTFAILATGVFSRECFLCR
jgi:hypothetical protein